MDWIAELVGNNANSTYSTSPTRQNSGFSVLEFKHGKKAGRFSLSPTLADFGGLGVVDGVEIIDELSISSRPISINEITIKFKAASSK